MLDVFNTDAFSAVSLTQGLQHIPAPKLKIGGSGIFNEEGITTTTVAIEVEEGTLSLVPNVARGTIPPVASRDTRKLHSIEVPHAPIYDAVMADEVQGKRAFGTENERETVMGLVRTRLAKMLRKLEVTKEFHMAQAMQGKIYRVRLNGLPESAAAVNLFTLLDLTENTKDFVLGTAGTEIITKCMEVQRLIELAMGGLSYTGVKVLCGPTFWDSFTTHAKVTTAFARWTGGQSGQGAFLREDFRDRGFFFGGMNWEEYGAKVGDTEYIPADEARAFPVGSELFQTRFAPAPFTEAVNTVGLPSYAQQELMEFSTGVKLLVQSNMVSWCARPTASVKLHTSN